MRRWWATLLALGVVAGACSSDDTRSDGDRTRSDAAPSIDPAEGEVVVDRNGEVLGLIGRDGVVEGDYPDAVDLALAELPSGSRPAGSVVETTFDVAQLARLDAALDAVPDTFGRFEVSAVVVDVTTGEVIAAADSADGSSLATLPRPTGSVLKFLVALAAVRAGALGEDVLDAGERCVIPLDRREELPLDERDLAQFSGDPSIGTAALTTLTAFSINCGFAKLYLAVGGDEVLGLARTLELGGVTVDSPTLVTGAASASPAQLARAMTVVLGDGTFRTPGVVVATTDVGGADRSQPEPQVVVDETVAHRTANLLRGVTEIGTASGHPLTNGRPFAGKTGTQADNTDAWFVGGTPELAVAVWMGNPASPSDQMVGVPEFGGIGRVQGGAYPAEVAQRFLDAALVGVAPTMWPEAPAARPPGLILAPGVDCAIDADAGAVDGAVDALPLAPLDAAVEACR